MTFRENFPAYFVLVIFLVTTGLIPSVARTAETIPEFLREDQVSDPLEFVGIDIAKRTEHSLKISWTTNHAARGKIKFGRKSFNQRKLQAESKEQHQVTFKNLAEGTRYRFRVFAWDNADHRIKSQVVTLRTKGTPPPRFRTLRVVRRGLTGGVIRWVTNVPTTAVLSAGHDTPLTYRTVHDTPTRFHEVTLDQFRPDHRLFYRVDLRDTRGRRTTSGMKSFELREPNVAWDKPVTGTFDRPIYGLDTGARIDKPRLPRVNDDKYDYQFGLAMSHDPADTVQWFVIDLERAYTPDTIVLDWWNFAYPEQYRVEASRFRRHWTPLARNLNAANAREQRIGGLPIRRQIVTPETGQAFRYVRVKIPEGASYYKKYEVYNFVALVEIKMFARDAFQHLESTTNPGGGDTGKQ